MDDLQGWAKGFERVPSAGSRAEPAATPPGLPSRCVVGDEARRGGGEEQPKNESSKLQSNACEVVDHYYLGGVGARGVGGRGMVSVYIGECVRVCV